jgi:hypothetical protein
VPPTFKALDFCHLCPSGSSGVDGLCAACPVGTKPSADRTSCTECPTGMASPGGIECTICPTGHRVHTSGGTCIQCPLDNIGVAGVCSRCPNGREPALSDRGSCHECSPGRAGQDGHCRICIPGTEPSSDLTFCVECDDGFYKPHTANYCMACSAYSKPSSDRSWCECTIEAFSNKTSIMEPDCIDTDECAEINGGCDALTECSNHVWGRSCGACPHGYILLYSLYFTELAGNTTCFAHSDGLADQLANSGVDVHPLMDPQPLSPEVQLVFSGHPDVLLEHSQERRDFIAVRRDIL